MGKSKKQRYSRTASPMQEIMAFRYEPVNNQARHGLSSRPVRLPLPDEPIPKSGIECSHWGKVKIEAFFKKRYPGMVSKTLQYLTDLAFKNGRIT